ncbi:uncharacterized protein LOC113745013 isoform X2 [Larimichthys crocea]|uniref:uncharacterized protein LOC113745013 isoform X2 n=1 Tax=Larimichthys crocea TaxID=215358 RepID=UPI000F5E0893|nr:uncharacterized protein LOC113745013 isoform X2 [Larimichthys crocea]XP_027132194.1 uncharacterized protein LOC113745013 isoform X2 [Larimichthys crocea]
MLPLGASCKRMGSPSCPPHQMRWRKWSPLGPPSSSSSSPPSSSSRPHLPRRKMSSRSSSPPSSSSPQSPQRPSSRSEPDLRRQEEGCLLLPGRRSRLPPPPHHLPRRRKISLHRPGSSSPGRAGLKRGSCRCHQTPPLSPPGKNWGKANTFPQKRNRRRMIKSPSSARWPKRYTGPWPPTSPARVGGQSSGTLCWAPPWVRKNTVYLCRCVVECVHATFILSILTDAYVEEYGQFIFCPEGTTKMQENAVSKISRAKVFLKYLTLGWSQVTYWTWEFLFNIPLLKCYPAVLRKTGLAPTTIILYVGQAISFVEYFRATPPKHSRITGGQLVVVIRELRKLLKDLNRTVLGHQALIKQAKGKRLVAREDLARCQALARAKIPSLLEDIEKAAPRDPKTRYRFFGYFAAYLTSIYGHRTGVLTRMRVREVREAIGDDTTGYLINVMEHKTVRKFGTAQIFLEAEEYGWCRTWIRLRARAVPTNGFFFSSLGRG